MSWSFLRRHTSSARAGQPPQHFSYRCGFVASLASTSTRKMRSFGVDGKPSVRGLNHSDRRTDAAFIRIDAFWSLLGALSQLQKRGSDCAVKKMTQA